MRKLILMSAAASMLGLHGVAHAAQTISSPAAFGGNVQNRAQCIVRNVGKTPTSVTVTIHDEAGNALPGSNFCGAPLQPGDNCSVFANIGNNAAYACSATTSGNAKHLRGTLVILDDVDPGDPEPLRSAELR
ncbi:MAG TPA: hypothetical protein VIS07_08540 [Candidatus Binatia bacterium]